MNIYIKFFVCKVKDKTNESNDRNILTLNINEVKKVYKMS